MDQEYIKKKSRICFPYYVPWSFHVPVLVLVQQLEEGFEYRELKESLFLSNILEKVKNIFLDIK